MPICARCSIYDKTLLCCGKYPLNGEQSILQLDNGETIFACPYLNRYGECIIYERRPQGCREFICEHYSLSRFLPFEGKADFISLLRSVYDE